jgi:hypothetical protein
VTLRSSTISRSLLPKERFLLVAKAHTFDRMGYIMASLSVGSKTIPQAKLEIFDLPHNGPPLCIGMDYFQALGFSIGGLPMGCPDECPIPATGESSAPMAPERDADPTTILFDSTSPETSSAHADLRANLMVHIQPALRANAMLPVSHLCPLPAAVVHVSTPPGIIFHRRQYPFTAIVTSPGARSRGPVAKRWSDRISPSRYSAQQSTYTGAQEGLDRPLDPETTVLGPAPPQPGHDQR